MQSSPLKRNNNYYDEEERASTRVRIEGEDGRSVEDQRDEAARAGEQGQHQGANGMVVD